MLKLVLHHTTKPLPVDEPLPIAELSPELLT